MPTLKPGTVFPTPEEDVAITAAALSDPDNQPLTDAELAQFQPDQKRKKPAHLAVDGPNYTKWLKAEVQEAIDDTSPTVPHEEAMRQVRDAIKPA